MSLACRVRTGHIRDSVISPVTKDSSTISADNVISLSAANRIAMRSQCHNLVITCIPVHVADGVDLVVTIAAVTFTVDRVPVPVADRVVSVTTEDLPGEEPRLDVVISRSAINFTSAVRSPIA